jgi:hypothetical protein
MDYKSIDIKKYKARLIEIREDAEQETDIAKRELIIKCADWLVIKLEEWHDKLQEYENTFDELEQRPGFDDEVVDSEPKNLLMDNYFDHLKEAGRLFYLYSALRIIRSEGKYWEDDAPSVKAVLDHVINLVG